MTHRLLFVCFVLLASAFAYEFDEEIKFPFNSDPTIVTHIIQFGFLSGGTVDFNISRLDNLTSSTLRFLVCIETTACTDTQCDSPSGCLYDELINSSLAGTVTIREAGAYILQIADLEKQDYQIQTHFHLLNPGGEELSYEDIPRYALRAVLAGVWFTIMAIWIGNTALYWSHHVKLHRVLTIYPLLKFAFCICASIFWANRSHGINISLWPYIIIFVSTKVSMLTLLLIAASGWGIHHKEFGKDRFFIFGTALGLATALILAYTIHSVFMVLSAVIYLVSVVMIFRYFNRSMIEILHHYHDVNEIFEIFYRLRIVFYALLCSFMLTTLFEVLFLNQKGWISEMLNEVLEITTCLAIGYVLRLKSVNIFGRWIDVEQPQQEPVEVELAGLRPNEQGM